SLDAPEIGNDDLIGENVPVEEHLAHAGVRGFVLEHAGACDSGAAHAGPGEKLTPAPGRFRVGDVDTLRVERYLAGAQARHGDEAGIAVADLDEQVLALLSRHETILSEDE